MSFTKIGSPQPIKIASVVCEECGQPATCSCDGKILCSSCKEKNTSSQSSN